VSNAPTKNEVTLFPSLTVLSWALVWSLHTAQLSEVAENLVFGLLGIVHIEMF